MKRASLIKTLGAVTVLVAAVVTLLGSSVYGEAPVLQIPVIQGSITYIDTDYNYLLIQGSDILDSDPLYLGSETCVFKGDKDVNFDELNRNARILSASHRVDLIDLNVGDEVCCTYSYSDGKLIADNIVIVTPVPSM